MAIQNDTGINDPNSVTQILARRRKAADDALLAKRNKSNLGAYSQLLADPMLPDNLREQIYQAAQLEIDSQTGVDPIVRAQNNAMLARLKAGQQTDDRSDIFTSAADFGRTALGSAIGGAISLPGDLLSLVPKTSLLPDGVGEKIASVGRGISEAGKSVQDIITPQDVLDRVNILSNKLKDDNTSAGEMAEYVVQNPDIWAYYLGQFLGASGVAKLGIKGVTKLAQVSKLIKGISLLKEATAIAGVTALGDAGSTANETYKEVLANTGGDTLLAEQARNEILRNPELWVSALAGSVPVGELAMVKRAFPTLAKMPWYARIFGGTAVEGGTEYGQEALANAAQMAATGDKRSLEQRIMSPESVKSGVIGGMMGATIGGIVGTLNPNPAEKTTKPKATGTGVTFSQIYPSISGVIGKDLARKAKAVSKNGGTVEQLRDELTKFLSTAPQVLGRKNKDELIATIPDFVNEYIAEFTKSNPLPTAAPGVPSTTAPAAPQAAGTPGDTTLQTPPVNAASATPVAPAAVPPGAASPAAATSAVPSNPVADAIKAAQMKIDSANKTAPPPPATTIGAPNVATVSEAVKRAQQTIDKANGVAKTAENNIDTATGNIAAAALGEEDKLGKTYAEEKARAETIAKKLQESEADVLNNTNKIRRAVFESAYNSARARGADEISARNYASEMRDSLIIPPNADAARIDADIQKADKTIAVKYKIRPIIEAAVPTPAPTKTTTFVPATLDSKIEGGYDVGERALSIHNQISKHIGYERGVRDTDWINDPFLPQIRRAYETGQIKTEEQTVALYLQLLNRALKAIHDRDVAAQASTQNLVVPPTSIYSENAPAAPAVDATAAQNRVNSMFPEPDIIDVEFTDLPNATNLLPMEKNRLTYDETYQRMAKAVGDVIRPSKDPLRKRLMLEDKSKEGLDNYPVDIGRITDTYFLMAKSAEPDLSGILQEMVVKNDDTAIKNFVAAVMEWNSGNTDFNEVAIPKTNELVKGRRSSLTKDFFKMQLAKQNLPVGTGVNSRPKE